MQRWDVRAQEIAFLLNPAFCSRILYNNIKTYCENAHCAIPFPLIYLILPLVLHKPTREKINSRTQLLVWVQKYPELLIDFPCRARDLVEITNESLEFLLQVGKVKLTSYGEIEIVSSEKGLSKIKFADDEVKDCLNKSEHVAKWFATTGKVETIYVGLGVRP